MQKYLQLFSIAWQNGFVYRTSVLLWRLRNFLATFMALTVWTVLLDQGNSVGSYTQSSAVTYIFIISLLQSVVLSTSLHSMSEFIYSGGLSIILIRPIRVLGYFAIQEVADKLKNFLFLVLETLILWLLFQPDVAIPPIDVGLLFILWTIGAVYLNSLVLALLGCIGFWSPETWAPRFLFFIFLEFTAGKLFPLDILPKLIQQVLFLSPLPYLSFMQTQLFLGKLGGESLLLHSAVFLGWIVLGTIVVGLVWKKGIREYAAAGQ